MSHTVVFDSNLGIVKTEVRGNLTPDEAKQLIFNIVQTARQHDCFLCLTDYRQATMEMSALAIYEVPERIAEVCAAHGMPAYKFKRAIVVANDLKDFHFFETVTLNRGQTVKLFHDIDQAREWLLAV
jgi:hypothetical protein